MKIEKPPKQIWVVSPVIGRTRYPVISPTPCEEWRNSTPEPGEVKFSKFTTDCVGCRGCEIVCASFKEKENNPSYSRIRVKTKVLEWIEGKTDRIVERRICRQCPGIPECMLACPVEGAMYRHPELGTVLVNDELCIRCKSCVRACPYDAIWYDKTLNKILKCDLCNGKPACVDWCPVQCLKFERIK